MNTLAIHDTGFTHRHAGLLTADNPLLTFKEAMTCLRISRSTLYRLMWSGQLQGHKVGCQYRFYHHDLLAAILPQHVEQSA